MKDKRARIFGFLLALVLAFSSSGCQAGVIDPGPGRAPQGPAVSQGQNVVAPDNYDAAGKPVHYNGFEIPAWDGVSAYWVLNNNQPFFSDEDKGRTDAFEIYSDLDTLGRCGPAYANICKELMPTEPRGEIGSVRPSGWHTIRYNGIVPGNYLYNRCHLIGFQLAGENTNEKNLITGTRYLNIEGMLGFENNTDAYVEATGNHVLYRVTPVYDGNDLTAMGVVMEGWSVEDNGAGICFCVFAYNEQPGVIIDHATGESRLADDIAVEGGDGEAVLFVLNTSSGKFHLPDCKYVESMSEANRLELTQTLEKMLSAGYLPCGSCHPDA